MFPILHMSLRADKRTLSNTGRSFLTSLLLLAFGAAPVCAQVPRTTPDCGALARVALPGAMDIHAEVVAPKAFALPAATGGMNGGPGGTPPPGGPQGGPDKPDGSGGGQNMMAFAPFFPKSTTNAVPFCRVTSTLKPSTNSNIKIELWLPLQNWNGKLLGVGNFGWAGSIMYGGLLVGLEQGYATVSTDTGHDNSLPVGAFALGHPEKMKDYGYRAAHEMTADAKTLVAALYGQAAAHAYFWGCSLGGQMALTEAQRFPQDYDGIIAGAPASPIVELNAYQIWPSLLVLQDPARQLTRAKSNALHTAVLAACDKLDGVQDGELENPLACHFDPVALACKGADANNCLTAPQAQMVKMLYSGPVSTATGKKLHEGIAYGNEGILGSASPNPMGVATALYKYMIFQDPNWDWKTLDMDRDIAKGRAVLKDINKADNPDLRPFFDRGGKLLMYHGWNDGNTPLTSIDYLHAVEQAVGKTRTDASMRLFAVPGMGHCMGGSGCDVFDKLGTLDAWVQTGRAPERIVASKLQGDAVVRTHPLCAWPKTARYTGTGSISDEKNFTCYLPEDTGSPQ